MSRTDNPWGTSGLGEAMALYREAVKKLLAEHKAWLESNPDAARFLADVKKVQTRQRVRLLTGEVLLISRGKTE